MEGNPRQSRKLVSHLDFDFTIESIGKWLNSITFRFIIRLTFKMKEKLLTFFVVCSISVCLPDSILAFHKNGMQGRSLKNGEITQEISDMSRTYRLLGSDKYVASIFPN